MIRHLEYQNLFLDQSHLFILLRKYEYICIFLLHSMT